ncbi:MAG: STAS domain-containing protein [Planctomycetota bacterium]|jgi:anti-anti-sigma factor
MSDPRLSIETIFHGPVALVRPCGWVARMGYAQLEASLRELESAGHAHVIVDLSAAHFLNSTGLTVFSAVQQKLKERGGCLVLATPSWATKRLLFEAGLYRKLIVCETVSEGLIVAAQTGGASEARPAVT